MKLSRFLFALLLCPMVASAATTAPVVGDAERAFHEWLATHNANELGRFQAYNAKYHASEDVQWDLDFRESTGSLQLLEIRRSSPAKVEALVLSEWGNAMLARLDLEADDATTLENLEFESTATPDRYRPAPMEIDALVAEAKRRLDALAADDKVSGSFLLAHDGEPVFEWVGGRADREQAIAVTTATRFRMASLGKMFTAVAILQLADAGKLSLDDRLSRHLPDYPNADVAGAITLRQLLSHTSGTGEIFGDAFARNADGLRTHRDYWSAYAATPLEFAPGSRDRYSNYGYILLGAVVEAVSGQDYYDYVDEHVFRVAGMTATGALPESQTVADRAHAYTKADGGWRRETATLPWRGTAAGGGYTTARDLMRFAAALEAGKLVSAESLRAMTSPQNVKSWYGFGFMVSGDGATRQYGHEGGAPGMNAILNVRPATGYAVVGLGNFDPSTIANVVNFVTRRLPVAREAARAP